MSDTMSPPTTLQDLLQAAEEALAAHPLGAVSDCLRNIVNDVRILIQAVPMHESHYLEAETNTAVAIEDLQNLVDTLELDDGLLWNVLGKGDEALQLT